MEAAPFAPDETGRLLAVKNLGLLDTPPEQRFDRIVQLAARLCSMPIGIMSIVAERRVFIKSAYGARRAGIALGHPFRDYWFCSHVIANGKPLVVEDAREDERFSRILLVTAEPGLRAYAGVPVRSPDGADIGTLAVFDTEPRTVSDSAVSALGELARFIEVELSRIPRAMSDGLTGVMNKSGFERLANRLIDLGDHVDKHCVLLRADIVGMEAINHTYGFDAGDQVLVEAARLLEDSVRGSDLVGRLNSDEFAVLLFGADADAAGLVMQRLINSAIAYNKDSGHAWAISFHIGGAAHAPGEPGDIAGLLLTAEPRRPNKGR